MSSSSTKWNCESYAAIPDDACRHEIIDGDHFVNLAPNLYHQTDSRRIQFQLYTAIEVPELGFVFDAPVDLQLSDQDIVQPDLVVISKAPKYIMTPTKIKGVPDLVVEIPSPSTRAHDQQRTRTMYELHGVPEYWIVDPEEHTVSQLCLTGRAYKEQTFLDSVPMLSLQGAVVDLTKVC